MTDGLLAAVAEFVVSVIDQSGYLGIFALMALEGSFLPIPSEIILPFSGYLVAQGRFDLWIVALMGALSNIAGTLFTYWISRTLGRAFLERWGKYVLVTKGDIDAAHRLFAKYGSPIIFFSRLLPAVRGFVPIPAGVAKMSLAPFILYVFVGSFLWSLFLTYLGVLVGENWRELKGYFLAVDWVILVLVVALGVWWVWRHIRALRAESHEDPNPRS